MILVDILLKLAKYSQYNKNNVTDSNNLMWMTMI